MSDKQRSLRKRELGCVLAIVVLRGVFDAVLAVSQINLIQINRLQITRTKAYSHLHGEPDLSKLPHRVGVRIVAEHVASDLIGDLLSSAVEERNDRRQIAARDCTMLIIAGLRSN